MTQRELIKILHKRRDSLQPGWGRGVTMYAIDLANNIPANMAENLERLSDSEITSALIKGAEDWESYSSKYSLKDHIDIIERLCSCNELCEMKDGRNIALLDTKFSQSMQSKALLFASQLIINIITREKTKHELQKYQIEKRFDKIFLLPGTMTAWMHTELINLKMDCNYEGVWYTVYMHRDFPEAVLIVGTAVSENKSIVPEGTEFKYFEEFTLAYNRVFACYCAGGMTLNRLLEVQAVLAKKIIALNVKESEK